MFARLLHWSQAGNRCVYLHGPSGTGKTHAAQALAAALRRPFRYTSLSPMSTPLRVEGYMDATGSYIGTAMRETIELGGVMLIDEIDNANANVLAALNAVLANSVGEFPDKQVARHNESVVLAAGNTIGMGATAAYTERRALDRATRDRFRFIHWDYAPNHEREIAHTILPHQAELVDTWVDWVQQVRAWCVTQYPELECSPRAIYEGLPLLLMATVEEVAEGVLFKGLIHGALRDKLLAACPFHTITRVDV
jgi:MoxR-like ATPase